MMFCIQTYTQRICHYYADNLVNHYVIYLLLRQLYNIIMMLFYIYKSSVTIFPVGTVAFLRPRRCPVEPVAVLSTADRGDIECKLESSDIA